MRVHMDNRFTIELRGNSYHIIKVFEGTDYYLYVQPGNKKGSGFFMTRTESGGWTVANRVLVHIDTLKLEQDLAGLISAELNPE